jgi:ubiquinone/menaquinone biosynthesis C-methylase UbiE
MALTREYHVQRQTRKAYRYRLKRRTKEVLRAIRKFGDSQPKLIVDIGTADGLMLEYLFPSFDATFVGLDISFELLTANPNRTFQAIQAEAMILPLRSGIFDIVIATAVIEHVQDGRKLLCECQRVLRKGGLLILTTPDPFFDRISGLVGHTQRDAHLKRFTITELKTLCQSCGLRTLKAEKFMMSPIGFPGENTLEKVMRTIGLNFYL